MIVTLFNYSQNIIEKTCVFTNGNISNHLSYTSGKRIHYHNYIKILPYKHVLDLSLCIDKFDKILLPEFIKLSTIISNSFQKNNLNVFSALKIHQEYINVNDIEDIRKYVSCRLVFSDGHNKFVEEFPVDFHENFLEKNFLYNSKKYMSKMLKKEKGYAQEFELNSVPIIFSPQATGYFIHEIVGHLLEEDMYEYLNKTMGFYYNENTFNINHDLTIIDSIEKENNIVGLSKYDDIGTPIRPIILIKNGRINNILSINSKNSFDGKLYGVARRQSFKYPALSRMRSTLAKSSGSLSQEEIVSKYKNAFFIENIHIGNCLPTINMYKLYGIGYFVESGEIVSDICNFNICGNISKDLTSIIDVGNDYKVFPSECVKGDQVVRVCMGGPTISIREGNVKGERFRN